MSAAVGFEAGPGNQLLDALVYHGTRGKELDRPRRQEGRAGAVPRTAAGAVARTPAPDAHAAEERFTPRRSAAAFCSRRSTPRGNSNAGLPDLLCTATHLAARAIGDAAKQWLPVRAAPRQVLVTGGGVRNGFLWQLVAQQFGERRWRAADEVGVPPLARNAAAAAVLAALTCDGVAGNLSVLTGAAGGRLLGHFAPGDGRNWAKVAAWVADQTGEYPRTNRAA